MRKEFLWVGLFLVLAGCNQGPARNTLTGKATFDGKPIPNGTIYFNPDASKNNNGPQGSAEIINGVYKTNPGFGAISGPLVVRINGNDGIQPPGPDGGMTPQGRPLFPEYQVSIDIPRGTTTWDFDVPAKKK